MSPLKNSELSKQELIEKFGESYLVSACMNVYGGGFCQTLAQLIQIADGDNLKRIQTAWPEYWNKYLDMHIEIIHRDDRVL